MLRLGLDMPSGGVHRHLPMVADRPGSSGCPAFGHASSRYSHEMSEGRKIRNEVFRVHTRAET
jgi:hypothetical protein